MITGGNSALQFASWDGLADAVKMYLDFVARRADMRSECRKGCVVLGSFPLINQHFAQLMSSLFDVKFVLYVLQSHCYASLTQHYPSSTLFYFPRV